MAGPIIKGRNSLVYSRSELRWDPQTRTAWEDKFYGGSVSAVRGAFFTEQQRGTNNQAVARLSEGSGELVLSRPLGNSADDWTPDRYEIVTEFVEKEIWSSPDVVAEAAAFDATISSGDKTYRKLAEDTAQEIDPVSVSAVTYPLFAKVVRHLKNGVTGFEREYVVLRRSRRIQRQLNSRGNPNPVASIGDGLLVYSTAQLLLPADVNFSVPDTSTLTASSSDYFWGWRRRPSQSVIEGLFVDQTSEFILSEWSTIHYEQSTVDAAW